MPAIYLLMGSNLGAKVEHIDSGLEHLRLLPVAVRATSGYYVSPPWGFEHDEKFVNRLVVIDTQMTPPELLARTQRIEHLAGRIRDSHSRGYTARTLDIDILYWDDRIIEIPGLTVPHPRLHLRRFALLPLCEVAPGMIHPVFGKTQEDLLAACTDHSEVTRLSE